MGRKRPWGLPPLNRTFIGLKKSVKIKLTKISLPQKKG